MKTFPQGRPVPRRLAVIAAMICCPVVAHAQQLAFDIPAGKLKAAVDAYVAVTGQQLLYRNEDLQGRLSNGAHGQMSREQALQQLLDGAGLKVRWEGPGAAVIFRGESDNGATSADGTDAQVVHKVIVTATALSHLSEQNRTGTRTDADPMTLPMTVSSVDKGLLEKQQALNLGDAVVNVAGVSQLNGDGAYTMRGFTAGLMRNGNTFITGTNYEAPLMSIARVEVVKGPEAIVAGVTSGYGGVINVITKMPQVTPVAEISVTGGSRGYYETGLDVGRPLTSDKSILVRFVASKQGADTTPDGFNGANNRYLSPSVIWRNRRTGTEIDAQYEYQRGRLPPSLSVFTDQPSLSGDLKFVRLGPPSDGTESRNHVTTISVNQHLWEEWEVTYKLSNERRERMATLNQGSVAAPFGFPFPEILSLGTSVSSTYSTKTQKFELKGGFDTGPVEHKVLLAYDNAKSEVTATQTFADLATTNLATGVRIDRTDTLGALFGGLPITGSARIKPQETGTLLSDQLLWRDWVMLASGRMVSYKPNALESGLGELKKFLPSLGVVYRVTPLVSVFGSAARAFAPNLGQFSISGNPVAPENAQQYELGVKSQLLDRRVAASLSLYSIRQHNVSVPDPAFPNGCFNGPCYLNVAGVSSRGLETEVSGEVTKHWGIRTAYSYTAVTTDADASTVVSYARHQGSIWAIYRPGDEANLGWWGSIGLQARSRRNHFDNYAENPGQARADLSAGYDATNWSVTSGVKNVAGKRLYAIGSGYFGAGAPYQPREFYLTARYKFN